MNMHPNVGSVDRTFRTFAAAAFVAPSLRGDIGLRGWMEVHIVPQRAGRVHLSDLPSVAPGLRRARLRRRGA
jgi:hypothetical protein